MIALTIYLDPKSKKLPHVMKIERINTKNHTLAQIQKGLLKSTTFESLQAMNLKSSTRSQAPNLMLLAKASRAAPSEKTLPFF